ncbi:hypothetical protein K469DRAFT_755471 [Zopfia rhizophila CBS 207.26]|uniref:Uncharacterized protein n=1 Tax=Zopfia rhizophila CBS 207.26 TaxID=1314779 RepID=A0A6A6DED6_9PEZI|nr:hypothetical protein K469DRAFT_755471 [Zopfia rhizophila CBS 207.26]
MSSAQILYMNRSPSTIKPHHVTILDISDTDIEGESMGMTDLNDYPWKMDAEITSGGNQEVLSPVDDECDRTAHMEEHANISPRAQALEQSCSMPSTEDADTRDAGPEIDGPLVAEARPTEQQATEDTVGDAARERVIPYELEPREDLSPLYDREMEEIDEESTALKKHSGHGGEVCKGRRPRKRLRGTKGTSIETAIVVDDDNDDDDKEIRRSTRTTIPPNQPGMVRWADPSFNKTAAEDFYRFWHAIKICWCVSTPLYPPVGSLPSFDLKHLPRRNGPKEFRQFALLMEKVCKRVKEKGRPENDAALTLWKEWKKICNQILLDTGDDDDSRCQQHGLREFDLLLRLLVKKEEVYQCTQISGKKKGIKKRKRQP